ncbi:MAG: GNAT family N-acetyltransferase [Lentisphaeraceae bacterium]|nr:GNAT family N-acetyltransferase [Lentisphaeraceae bacterium]
MKITLEKPNDKWKYSYLSLVEEFKFNNEDLIPWVIGLPFDDFSDHIEQLDHASKGIGLKTWQVPHATFWLVVNDKVVGVSNLRLKLNEKLRHDGGNIGYGIRPSLRRKGFATILLKKTLKKAKDHGIEKCLVMCDKDNIASAKTILNNGGLFDSDYLCKESGKVVNRYLVNC